MNRDRATVFVVMIGNSDDKLRQAEWAAFVAEVDARLPQDQARARRHGNWRSRPDDPWQNAAWLIEVDAGVSESWFEQLQKDLQALAGKYRQDSIGWLEGTETWFLRATRPVPDLSEAGDCDSA